MSEAGPARAQAVLVPAVPGIEIAWRRIAPGDARELLAAEIQSIETRVPGARAASGAARAAARALLERLGAPGAAIPKHAGGAPVWPAGLTGSLAHDEEIAVAALARCERFAALGVDVEPAEPLPPDVLAIVATVEELRPLQDNPLAGRLAFVAKEAVYKALQPLDGLRLEYDDIRLDLANGRATTRGGRAVHLRFSMSERIVVLAFLSAEEAAAQRRVA